MVPIARVLRLDGDNAIAMPLADPSESNFAIVQQPYEPQAMATPRQAEQELP